MNLEALKKRYADILERMNAIAEGAKKEARGVSDEERSEFDSLESELDVVKRDIARAEKLAKENEERSRAVSKPVDIEVTRNEGEDENGKCAVWRSLGEQLMAVRTVASSATSSESLGVLKKLELSNKIMRAATGMQESVMADGGFLVQAGMADTLIDRAMETGKLASQVQRYGLSGNNNGIKLPFVDETSRANGSRNGGIQAYWEGEADQYTKSKPKLGQIELKLKKLTGLCYLTDELLEDVSVLESFVSRAFAEEFGFKIDDAILNGDGQGKPLGILNSPALVVQAKESGQAANTIVAANIANMYARLPESSLAKARWGFNPGCKAQLMTLSLTVGSNTYPVMIPGGITGSVAGQVPVASMLGLPAQGLEQCAALSAQGDILVADYSQYIWVDKGGVKADRSIHVRFEYGEQAFRFTYRADGMPSWKSALTPYKGSNTLSPYVTLQNR